MAQTPPLRILLTGANGNLGASALAELARRGHRVRALFTDPERSALARRLRGRPEVEVAQGDLRDAAAVGRAVAGQDAVVHLAAIIPPLSDERPELARAVNVGGTRALLEACGGQPRPPRFLFASTLDVYGDTTRLPPPRTLGDPVVATDIYTETKLEGERLVRESGLPWATFRLAMVPLMALRAAHPIMFRIPLAQRMELLHTRDAALAVANALEREAAWGATWLVGGGPSCQVTYGEFLFATLDAAGIGALPRGAFTTEPYCTDWLDTAASQALLDYQRRSFADIIAEFRRVVGWRRPLARALSPLIRRQILRLAPPPAPPRGPA